MSNSTYGFVGLGNMGGPMVGRLLAAGNKVIVVDRDEAAVSRVVDKGATKCATVAELSDAAEVVFLSLPDGHVVEAVVAGFKDAGADRKVKTVVDLSTIGPKAAKAAAATLEKKGITYVDAPISGGVGGAEKGTLAVMVACAPALYETLVPVLKNFGTTFHLGHDVGQAQVMKLANNLLSAAAVAITSEAMAFGVKAGLDPKIMLDVINAGSGRNSATMEKFPKSVITGLFNVGFAARLAHKDVRLCLEGAEAAGVPMIVGSAVREMLVLTTALHGPTADYSDVARVVEDWAGVKIRSKS